MGGSDIPRCLRGAARLDPSKILGSSGPDLRAGLRGDLPVLVLLAAGKGTRFGADPKCVQPVRGKPLARHTVEAFRSSVSPQVVSLVGYRHEEVVAALGGGIVFVLSDNPSGGTGFAAYEALSVPELEERNPLLLLSMGDRMIPSAIFSRLLAIHAGDGEEADLTLLTALYEPPKNKGKGRIVRDGAGRVVRIVEQRDIDGLGAGAEGTALDSIAEGNCPLYALRARTLARAAAGLTSANAQGQFYVTDIVEALSRAGGEIRTLITTVADPEYDLLCADVTGPGDLALLERILDALPMQEILPGADFERAAACIKEGRPAGQAESIACQLEELLGIAGREDTGWIADQPVGIGVCGGRLRIAFMHPDMGRFLGPAWQMPIGARDASGREQIVILAQAAHDGRLRLHAANPRFRCEVDSVPAGLECMYPAAEVADWYSYEGFGTRMAEALLSSFGFAGAGEVERRRREGEEVPPPSLWIASNMRHPFSLVANALASLRTVRRGGAGARVQAALGRAGFEGLRLACVGDIPQGGFSSSSAMTLASMNALNALHRLCLPAEQLIDLACQAEYGTGVRAGPLDHVAEQKGRASQGSLISSNPRDNYRLLGAFPMPSARYRVIFPYSVDRDREAWRWSRGFYSGAWSTESLTAAEMRKMTGKLAEIAALLVRLPLGTDFFKELEEDFLREGAPGPAKHAWVCDLLRALPLRIGRDELRAQAEAAREWCAGQLAETQRLDATAAGQRFDQTLESLFAGWREPLLRRSLADGSVVEERGVPLRAVTAYLFGETAKNFRLIRHPEEWIRMVSLSQLGDRCFDLAPERLPPLAAMLGPLEWEEGLAGPALMERWLERFGARPFDFNRGLDDETLAARPPLHLMQGSNFFRGLALVDLAEAMLHRAFGADAVAVRVNAAGQGDFFQVHVDTSRADVEEVKDFIRRAVYRRFGLCPVPDFVEPHPGGGALGLRLDRLDRLPTLIEELRRR